MFLPTFLSIFICYQLAIAQHTSHPASLQVQGETEHPTRWRPFHSQEGDLISSALAFCTNFSFHVHMLLASIQGVHYTRTYPTKLKPPPPSPPPLSQVIVVMD